MAHKKRKVKKYVILLIVVVILVGLWLWISSNAKKAMSTISQSYVVENIVQKENLEIKITGSGVVEPQSKVNIYAPLSGEVKVANYEQADRVKKDATLFKIGTTSVKTPIAGTLITKNVEKGEYVQVNNQSAAMTPTQVEPIAVVADISTMKVKIEVDELDIGKITKGMDAQIMCDAIAGKVYTGKVSKIAAEGTSTNGVTTYPVTILIENPEDLKIGMNTDVTILVEKKENVLSIPMDTITKENNNTYVYVKQDNLQTKDKKEQTSFKIPSSMAELSGYRKIEIEIGKNNNDQIEVLSGLSEGDKIYSIRNTKSLTEYMMSQSTNMP